MYEDILQASVTQNDLSTFFLNRLWIICLCIHTFKCQQCPSNPYNNSMLVSKSWFGLDIRHWSNFSNNFNMMQEHKLCSHLSVSLVSYRDRFQTISEKP